MKEEKLKQLSKILSQPKNIVLVPHKNPDGDAMGSTIGLKLYLQQLGHNACVMSPNDYPNFLKWLPNSEDVVIYDDKTDHTKQMLKEADLIFTLDFNHLGRCGEIGRVLEGLSTTFVMIDHHQQPDSYASFMYSDTEMSSTCQMVYHFIEMMNHTAHINSDIATCLYTGIMTDTGSFRFRSTTSTTHKVISNLIESGADNTKIHENIYDSNTLSRLQLKGVALKNLNLLTEYKTAYIHISQTELNSYGYKKGDTEGFVNIGLSIEGINFAVIFIENEQEGIIKMSFRSKGDFSVNEFARKHFEGGGHNNAAGGKSNRSLNDTIKFFKSLLPEYKNSLLQSQ